MNVKILHNDFNNDIISNNPLKRFRFDNFLDDIIELIFNHTNAYYNQIELKALQNIAFLFSFGGFNKSFNLGFYAVDLSPSGTGKTTLRKQLQNLLLKPVIDITHDKLRAFIEENEKETPPIIKAIHGNLISNEALYEAFNYIPTQMIEIGELGKAISKDHPILEAIIDLYGTRNLTIPTFKNNKNKKSIIENTDLFFYGDTNLEYLGIKQFFNHLKGGLLNRALLVYNNNIKPYELEPRTYTIPKPKINQYNTLAKDIMDFSKREVEPLREELLRDNVAFDDFSKNIHTKLSELTAKKDPFKELYVRIKQNIKYIIFTLHLIECFEKNYYCNEISNTAIDKGVEYAKYLISSYDELIEAINEQNISKTEERIINKTKDLLKDKPQCSIRDIYRPLGLKKSLVKSTLSKYDEFKIIDTDKQTIIQSS